MVMKSLILESVIMFLSLLEHSLVENPKQKYLGMLFSPTEVCVFWIDLFYTGF